MDTKPVKTGREEGKEQVRDATQWKTHQIPYPIDRLEGDTR
jgi:hypothetical protein